MIAGRFNKLALGCFALVLCGSPVLAQTKLTPSPNKHVVDNCAPIGQTARHVLIYSMKCDNLPAPPPPPVAQNTAPSEPAEPEVRRTGIFDMSFDRRPEQ